MKMKAFSAERKRKFKVKLKIKKLKKLKPVLHGKPSQNYRVSHKFLAARK